MTQSVGSAGSTETSRSAAPAKACWSVKLPGRKPFAMVGTKMKEAEALETARRIWPEAEVE